MHDLTSLDSRLDNRLDSQVSEYAVNVFLRTKINKEYHPNLIDSQGVKINNEVGFGLLDIL